MNGVLSVTYAPVNGFAAAAVLAGILVTCVGASGGAQPSQTVAPGTGTVTFNDLPADTYTFTAAPVDANGNALIAPGYSVPSTSLTISAPGTVTLNVPSALSAVAQ